MSWRVSKPEEDGREWTFGVRIIDGDTVVVKDKDKAEQFREFGYIVKPITTRKRANDN